MLKLLMIMVLGFLLFFLAEFFISIDRQCGPLTLHNSLVDLVRYVKHGLKVLKISDIS